MRAKFEPEVYIQKAEDDIRQLELARASREPPWDGTEQDTLKPTRQSASGPLQSSAMPAPSAKLNQVDSILQQIQAIAQVPQEQRAALLAQLAEEAKQVARDMEARGNRQAARRLQELAAYAQPPANASQGSDPGISSLRPQLGGLDRGHLTLAGRPAAVSSVVWQGALDGQDAASSELQTAIACIDASDLHGARGHLDAALAACKPDQAALRLQIQRRRVAIQQALR